MNYFAAYLSPIGPLLLVSDGSSLTGLYMGREVPEKLTELNLFDQTKKWLDAYFSGQIRDIDFPIKASGTAFQEMVWESLLEIPFGRTRTYGEIARDMALALGKEKMSAQAVGGAVGKNPISIIIPCHRVMGARDRLTGYGGGIENKLWLLRHEGWEGEGKL